MRLYPFVLLAATARLACVSYASEMTAGNVRAQGVSTRRVLSTSEAFDKDDEARMLKFYHALTESARVRNWRKQGLTDEQIIENLLVGSDVSSFLQNPRATILKKMLLRHEEQSSSSHQPLISVLMKHMNEDELARRLYEATESESQATNTVATKLLNQLFNVWMAKNEPPENIATLICHDELLAIFTNLNWKVVCAYVEAYKVQNPSETLIATFRRYFGDDYSLLEALKSALPYDGASKKNALQLEQLLLRSWIDEDLEPEEVLTRLRFGISQADELRSPMMETVLEFVDMFNAKKNQQYSLVNLYREAFSDAEVTTALIIADSFYNMEKYSDRLKAEQIRIWVSEKKTEEEVSAILELEHKKNGAKQSMLNKFKEALENEPKPERPTEHAS